MKRKCALPGCEVEFEAKPHGKTTKKYCCRKHTMMAVGGRDLLPKEKRICILPECGKEFIPRYRRHKYCCNLHCLVAHGCLLRPLKKRKCDWCQQFFLPKNSRQHCCRPKCEHAFLYRQKHGYPEPLKKNCLVCNEEFLTTPGPGMGNRQKYCSPKCRASRYRQSEKGKMTRRSNSRANSAKRRKTQEGKRYHNAYMRKYERTPKRKEWMKRRYQREKQIKAQQQLTALLHDLQEKPNE